MYELDAALVLSPGNKAQTEKDGILYVVREIQDTNRKMIMRFSSINHEGRLMDDGYRTYQDIRMLLVNNYGLDPNETIWHPIGYTAIPGGLIAH